MKRKNLIIIPVIFTSFLLISSCSKNEKIEIQKQDDSAELFMEEALVKLAESGVDISKKPELPEGMKSGELLRAGWDCDQIHIEGYGLTNCERLTVRISQNYCFPSGTGYYYTARFYMYKNGNWFEIGTGTYQYENANLESVCLQNLFVQRWYFANTQPYNVVFAMELWGGRRHSYLGAALSNIITVNPNQCY